MVKKLYLIGTALILGAIAATVSGCWNPFAENPDKVISQMSEKMASVTTSASVFSLSLNGEMDVILFSQQIKQNFNLKLEGTGKEDLSDMDSPKTEMNISGSFGIQGIELALDVDMITVGQDVYAKINKMPLLGAISEKEDFSGQWIKMDPEEINEKAREIGFAKNELPQPISDEQLKKIEELLKSADIYIFKERYKDKTLESGRVHHYKVRLDKEEIKRILQEAAKISAGEEPLESAILAVYGRLIDQLGDMEADLYIGKKDKYLHRVEMGFTMDFGDLMEVFSRLPGGESFSSPNETWKAQGVLNGAISLSYKDFNQPVSIEAPEEYNSYFEFFESRLGFPLKSPSAASNSEFKEPLDSDGDGLPDSMEAIYGTDPDNPDTDGDGFLDGEEVKKGYDPLGPGKLF